MNNELKMQILGLAAMGFILIAVTVIAVLLLKKLLDWCEGDDDFWTEEDREQRRQRIKRGHEGDG